MPPPLSLAVRQRLFGLYQRGLVPAAIARELGLPPSTVRSLCARFTQDGAAALKPAGVVGNKNKHFAFAGTCYLLKRVYDVKPDCHSRLF